MRKQIYRGLLFSIPILLLLSFITVIDPYEFINVFHVIKPEKKVAVLNRSDASSPRGNMLWKWIHYRRSPVKNILIGDSQCRGIDEILLQDLTGKPWYNLCVPGASYETMFDNFWFAVKNCDIEQVYFGVSFMNYNNNRAYNISHFASDYFEKPYLYFTNKDIFFDSWMNLRYTLSGNSELVDDPHESAPVEEMDVLAEQRLNLFYKNYNYPDSLYFELQKITKYCKENKIDLVFLIMPTYSEMKRYLIKKELWDEYMEFKADIESLGKLIDYDTGLPLSESRECFTDFFHLRKSYLNEITKEIWGENSLREGVYTSGF